MARKNKILLFIFLAIDAALVVFAFRLILMPQVNLPNFALLNPKGVIAQKERALIFTAVGLMLAVVLPMFAFIIFLIRKNKTKKIPDPATAKDSLKIEFVLWTIPVLLIFILSIINWKSTHDLDPYKPLQSNVKPITIQVVALPWKWLFIYPEQNIATVNFIEFPKNTPVNFQLTADAPMSVFWIPQLGGQVYAMAGMSTQLKLMADENGEFNGSAAEINGAGFAGMRFVAKATSGDDFNAWVSSVRQSSNLLSISKYNKLAEPSENDPRVLYSDVESGLYNKVMTKFMAPEPQMQTIAASSSSPMTMQGMQTNVATWKIYKNIKYGFQFPYSASANVSLNGSGKEGDVSLSLYSFNEFSWLLSDGAFEEALKYDQVKNQWGVSLGINESASNGFCPFSHKTKTQQLPYYQIGDFRSGRLWNFAYVTRKGIIVLSIPDFNLPILSDPNEPYVMDPSKITFDNPKGVLTAGCKINN